jgi:hypothetical protein
MELPTQLPWYPEYVPDELKQGRVWVCWEERDGTKRPLIAGTRRLASHSDPKTWRPFATACKALAEHPNRYAGLGRVITEGGPYVGVDLDAVRNPTTRELSSKAVATLRRLDSYSEVSPSGEGVKVWVRADLPRSYRKPGVEVYAARRYFTLTGAFLGQFSLRVEQRQLQLEDLVHKEFPQPSSSSAGRHTDYQGPPVELDEYLDGVQVLGKVPDSAGVKLAVVCPWVEQHSNQDRSGTYVGRRADGGLWFACWHSHCASRGWTEFRRYVRLQAKKIRLIRKGVYA